MFPNIIGNLLNHYHLLDNFSYNEEKNIKIHNEIFLESSKSLKNILLSVANTNLAGSKQTIELQFKNDNLNTHISNLKTNIENLLAKKELQKLSPVLENIYSELQKFNKIILAPTFLTGNEARKYKILMLEIKEDM